jgi:hypothetical protein
MNFRTVLCLCLFSTLLGACKYETIVPTSSHQPNWHQCIQTRILFVASLAG